MRLYYGTFNEDATAYMDAVKQWEELGVKITTVYSDRGKGYVQDVFAQVCQLGHCLLCSLLLRCVKRCVLLERGWLQCHVSWQDKCVSHQTA